MKNALDQNSHLKNTKTTKSTSKNHEIIRRLIKVEIAKGDKYFWPREMKLAGKLLKLYPFDFLIQLKEPFYPLKMNSLAWFLTTEGENFLSLQFFEYTKRNTNLSIEKEEIKLSPTKIGEDIQVIKKPKTLKDFLNLYGKSERNPTD